MRAHRRLARPNRKNNFRPTLQLLEDRVTPAPIGTAHYPGDKLLVIGIGAPQQWAHPTVVPRLAQYQTVVLGAPPNGHDPDTSDGGPTSYATGIQRIRTAAASIPRNNPIQIGLYFNPAGFTTSHPLHAEFLRNNWFATTGSGALVTTGDGNVVNFSITAATRRIAEHVFNVLVQGNLGGVGNTPPNANFIFWDNARMFSSVNYDFDRDGSTDTNTDQDFVTAYQAGWMAMLNRFRELVGPNFGMMGNIGQAHFGDPPFTPDGPPYRTGEAPPAYMTTHFGQGGLLEIGVGYTNKAIDGFDNAVGAPGAPLENDPSNVFTKSDTAANFSDFVKRPRYFQEHGLNGADAVSGLYSALQVAVVSTVNPTINQPSTVWNNRVARWGLAVASVVTDTGIATVDTGLANTAPYGTVVDPNRGFHAIEEIPEFDGGVLNNRRWMGRPTEPSKSAPTQLGRLWSREFENALVVINQPDNGDDVPQLTNVSTFTLPNPGAGREWRDLNGNRIGTGQAGATVSVQERDAVFVHRAVLPVPEIAVSFGAVNISDGDATPSSSEGTDFGSVAVGSNVNRTFTISNTGGATLSVGAFTVTGAGFSLLTAPAASVVAGGSTTFVIRFAPTTAGSVSGSVSFINGDNDESPFNFDVVGVGTSVGPVVLFSDDFNRPDNGTVGNGWVEVETSGAVSISSNRLFFGSTGPNATNLPLVRHSFTQVSTGRLSWEFEFNWDRSSTATDTSYRVFMQLGQGSLMSNSSQSAGVGVNLVWTAIGGQQERLGSVRDGVTTNLSSLVGLNNLRVVANLDTDRYDVFVGATQVGTGIQFEDIVNLDTVRFFTDSVTTAEVSFRRFDNVVVTRLGSPLRAADGAVAACDCAPLTEESLRLLIAEAVARWGAVGADVTAVRNAEVRLADLPGDLLGLAAGPVIWVDIDAAGRGWFIDLTPGEDSEFGDGFGPAGMDLLTLLLHEQGHVLGLPDIYEEGSTSLMTGFLPAGTRRQPTALEADRIAAGVVGAGAPASGSEPLAPAVGQASVAVALTGTAVSGLYRSNAIGTPWHVVEQRAGLQEPASHVLDQVYADFNGSGEWAGITAIADRKPFAGPTGPVVADRSSNLWDLEEVLPSR